MKILKYWKEVELEPWAKFMIVPERIVQEPHTLFDKIVEVVRASDYSYILYEQKDTLIESRR